MGTLRNAFAAYLCLYAVLAWHEVAGHFFSLAVNGAKAEQIQIGIGPSLLRVTEQPPRISIGVLPIVGFVIPDKAAMEDAGMALMVDNPLRLEFAIEQIVFIMAGPFASIFGGLLLYLLFYLCQKREWKHSLVLAIQELRTTVGSVVLLRGVIGPIRAFTLLGDKTISAQSSLLTWGDVSISLGIGNLLPLPILDGYKGLAFFLSAAGHPEMALSMLRYEVSHPHLWVGCLIVSLIVVDLFQIFLQQRKSRTASTVIGAE